VNLEIKQGDLVGIIGRNGAGKSTLLKILSRVTAPTTGSIKVKGRIGSLLEVGTGFHPELTGRENVFLNGAILGMRKKEILNKFDEIVDFAEIEKFIDTPVKRYSSGMYVRLAFAVAAHLDPEILVVDEVLAVGDAQFQKKCLGKMGDVSNNEGRTVLFVSHNMTAIRSLCRNAVQLDHGMVEITGDVQRVVSSYLSTTKAVHERIWDTPEIAPGNESVRFHYARVAIDMPNPPDQIRVNTPLKLEFAFWNYLDNAKLNFSMHVLNAEGMMVFNSGGGGERCPKGLVQGICYIPGNFLNDEKYSIMMMIVIDGSHGIFTIHDLLQFDVLDVERDGAWMGKWPGVVRPALKWDVKALGCF
jgi:lipopolysaccharide transport system ATP-binding protein